MSAEATTISPRKILVVDDNEIILRTVAAKLRQAGYQPFLALDGLEAVTVARETMLDVVLLDINFPPDVYGQAWDGFHIINWLRRLENTRQVPIIMISSTQNASDREQGAGKYRIDGPVFFRHLSAAIYNYGIPHTTT